MPNQTIVSANLDYTRDGDRRYLRYLRSTYDPAVACLQEVERGLKGTRVRGWGVKVGSPRRVVFGRRGAHRAIAWRWVWIDGVQVRVISVHGLHARTVGRAVQTAHLMMLVTWLLAMRKPWVLAGDFNRRPAMVARKLKVADFVAHKVDGVIVSKGLRVHDGGTDTWGVRNKVTDHAALIVTVSLAGAHSYRSVGDEMSNKYTNPLQRPSWRGRTNVDALTILAIEAAEELAGFTFTVTQGSYQNTVSASAGTHSGGGVVDLSVRGLTETQIAKMIRSLRLVGFSAWDRKAHQGPWVRHAHAVLNEHPLLAPQAAAQVTSLRNGHNGLKNNAADDGPKVPYKVFTWPEEPKEYPKRILTYLKNNKAIRQSLTAEIQRLRLARDVAANKGEPLKPFTLAIRRTRRARKVMNNARKVARKVQKR